MRAALARQAALALLALVFLPAAAQNSSVLIQLQPGGDYRIWHGEGASHLDDDLLIALDARAADESGEALATPLGPAKAVRTPQGVMIELPAAPSDRALLLERDACGHLNVWHADGATRLSEEQATDLVMAAVPGGGPTLALDARRRAKSYLTPLGVMVAIWTVRAGEPKSAPAARQPDQ